MTEQEVIGLLQNLNIKLTEMSGNKINGIDQIYGWDEITAISEAIKALEEIQQYRAIGTPEEFLAAVEKQKAKKPHKNFEKFSGVWCSCGKYLGIGYFIDKTNYCPDCGQKLDWSDEE